MAKLNIRNRNKNKLDKDGRPKAPNWEYRFEAAKVDGKRRSISKAGFRTKKDAETAGAKAMAEYNNAGLKYEPSEMSYADFLDYWYENYVILSCRYNTQEAYSRLIRLHLKPALGGYKLKSLTPVMLQDFINKKSMAGFSRAQLKNILCALTGSLKYAVVPAKLLPSSPAEYIKLPRLQTDQEAQKRAAVSLDDFHRIMERFKKGDPFRYALLIGFYTGLRIGEVHALTWDDIDLKEGTLEVNKQVYKRDKKKEENSSWYFGPPKSRASSRRIKIGATLIRELREYRTMQLSNRLEYGEHYTRVFTKPEKDEKGKIVHRLVEAEDFIPVGLPEVDMVMRKENGRMSTVASFRYASRVIHYDLQISSFSFHGLRHAHATTLIESGISPKAVQARLGHDKIETTLQTYVHNTEAMEDAAVDAFESAVSTIK